MFQNLFPHLISWLVNLHCVLETKWNLFKDISLIVSYWPCLFCCCGTDPRRREGSRWQKRTWSNRCPQLGGFSVKRMNQQLLRTWREEFSMYTGVSRFFVSKFFLSIVSSLDFGAKKRYLNGWGSVFQTESSWFCFTPELRSEEARAAPSRTLTITCGCNSLWWNLALLSDVRAEILQLGKPAGRHFKHLGKT